MRRSKIAQQFLVGCGIKMIHSSLELRNFSAGTGSVLPYQIIRMRRLSGDSKETVGWCLTLEQARIEKTAMIDGHRASQDETEWTYYIRNIQTGEISK